MMTTIAFVNTSIPSFNYYYFFVVRTFKISFSNFQLYNTVLLAVIIMLYVRTPEPVNLITGSFGVLIVINLGLPPQRFFIKLEW